jgi:hypothetical protein
MSTCVYIWYNYIINNHANAPRRCGIWEEVHNYVCMCLCMYMVQVPVADVFWHEFIHLYVRRRDDLEHHGWLTKNNIHTKAHTDIVVVFLPNTIFWHEFIYLCASVCIHFCIEFPSMNNQRLNYQQPAYACDEYVCNLCAQTQHTVEVPYVQMCVCMCIYTPTKAYTPRNRNVGNARIHLYQRACVCIHIHCIYTRTLYVYTYSVRIHIHTHTHTYIHTYIHTYTGTELKSVPRALRSTRLRSIP